MVDFKIRRGLSTTLFLETGELNPRLVIEEGCWYLCTDTAELYLGVLDDSGLTLKQINGPHNVNRPTLSPDDGTNGEPDDSFAELEFTVGELQDELASLKATKIFKRLEDESELPDVDSEGFNPNITYYIQQPDSEIVSTFIYDDHTKGYLCTNAVVNQEIISVISANINDAGELTITYSNGDVDVLGRVVGKDGKDGEDGLTTAVKIGDKLYSHNNGVIELPEFPTKVSELENDLGYLTEHQDLSEYVKKSELPAAGDIVTKAELQGAIDAIEHPVVDLDNYATVDYVTEKITEAKLEGGNVDLSGYATKAELDGLATEAYVDEKFASMELPDLSMTLILRGGDANPADDQL